METIAALCEVVRSAFPDIAAKADREYLAYWGEPFPEYEYSWFQSLANALNAQMKKAVAPANHLPLFTLISDALGDCSAEVRNCIDVSFVENLFWQVPADRAEGYWQQLPAPLKQLYLGFHRRAPA
ncbi:DUF7674 family protein [Pseudomonas sp. Gutcm_11s]|uniref:DUF7674 family protein n=1 Tax=Pseudomonas sp. Gutcm_11s TaxID=3026088 RepID=UPI00235F407B|nr:hypothetical protein [Pseudomonas sp. Gutcm_11s]MDD0844294.1 hypothetical protein [Pseudomonas sp. Gutcm_11s]